MLSRRDFIGSAAALTAMACARSGRSAPSASAPQAMQPGERLPLGFSTLGCPQWEWSQILDFAATHGYTAIELRGLQKEMDLTKRPEFAPTQLDTTRRQVAERGLRISCLGASANMHEMVAGRRTAAMDEGRRFIDLARELQAPYVRVFGNQYVAGVPRDDMLAHIAGALHELGMYASGKGVTVLIESHGDFTDSPTLLDLMRRADSPAVAILWDAHHTFAASHEQPEDTVKQLGPWIRHTHLKDSRPEGKDRRYVLLGQGDVPVRRQIEALAGIGYRGIYSFEWEKRWHPEIEEPEIAFAQFAQVAGGYLRSAGVKSS